MKKLLHFLLILLLFSSCSEFNASLKVFRGNYHFLQGEYQDANIQYLRAAEAGMETDIVNYNLGTVYNALGETESAVSQWEPIIPREDVELAFRLAFNQGVLNYQLGNYQTAFDFFRQALIIDPTSTEARINLEHSFRKLNVKDDPPSAADSESLESEAGEEDIQRVLEYIRRNEPYYPPEAEQEEQVRRDRDW